MIKSVSVLLASVVVWLLFASSVLAHGRHEHTRATTVMAPETTAVGTLSPSGGPDILLPAAALLLGAGILSYAVLRPTT
jgi:hypothetical protein